MPRQYVQVFLNSCNAGTSCSLGNSLGDSGTDTLVECLGDDVIGRQFLIGDQIGQSHSGSHLHFLVDVRSTDIEGAAEDAGEGQHVVDLVGIVAAAGGDDLCAAGISRPI